MDKKNTELQEQDAPLKNTDQAFVQVGEDGKPAFPEEENIEKDEKESNKQS